MINRISALEALKNNLDAIELIRADIGSDRSAALAIVEALSEAGYVITDATKKEHYKMRDVEYEVASIISKRDAGGAETANEIVRLIDRETAKACDDLAAKMLQGLKANGNQEAAEVLWGEYCDASKRHQVTRENGTRLKMWALDRDKSEG